ncbi:MAG: hypothetical protein QOG49_1658 [Frankiaceae bacterium]|nr:hypothetical protein [Frankiaceae bacterium]
MKLRGRLGGVLPTAALLIVLTSAVGLIVAGVLLRRPAAHDPLFDDPMADVQTTGATRIARQVQQPKGTSSASEPQRAQVLQVFRAAGEGARATAVRDQLVQQARATGWTINSATPDASGVIAGKKVVAGRAARLGVSVDTRVHPDQVNVVLVR